MKTRASYPEVLYTIAVKVKSLESLQLKKTNTDNVRAIENFTENVLMIILDVFIV